jgi:diguanylate cyclase (GGDEF)-like protein
MNILGRRTRKTPSVPSGAPVGRSVRPLQVLLTAFLVGLMVSVEVLVLRAYVDARHTSASFRRSTLTLGNLANAQRETLLLYAESRHVYEGEENLEKLRLQRMLLGRQLHITGSSDVSQEELRQVHAALRRFDSYARYFFQGSDGRGRRVVARGLATSAAILERRVKYLYDRQEQRFFGELSKELWRGATSQRALLLLGMLVMALALTLAVLLRRSVRSDFQKAYDVLVREVEERKLLEEQLTHQAFHDALTGLANRALFIERVEQAVRKNQQHDETMAVIFVDLDDFKTINDTLGHEAGDALLKEAARRLSLCLRGEDTAARLGGDEFAVLLEHSSDAERVAQRILEALQSPMRIGDHVVAVAASLGIALGGPEIELASTVLANADIAMYAAKSKGKGHYAVFAPGMQEAAETRMRLRAGLHRALEEGQFTVHYQPIMNLKTRQCAGAEALVRWNHPEVGLISPANFIPVAEESGFIYELGCFVLNRATTTAAGWQHADSDRALSISVNVSARQLQNANIVGDVKDALSKSGLRPELLVLEVTESVLMVDPERVAAKLTELRDLGVGIAIDDFGTGCSSLGYLKRLPVDTLKIDKSFLDGLEEGPENSALARAVIKLGATLSLDTVAEGIETPGELELLIDLGCNYGQGYLFSRPLDEESIEQFLASSRELVLSSADAVGVRLG